MLCMLGKNFSRRHLEIFYLFFLEKQDLKLHENCLQFLSPYEILLTVKEIFKEIFLFIMKLYVVCTH